MRSEIHSSRLTVPQPAMHLTDYYWLVSSLVRYFGRKSGGHLYGRPPFTEIRGTRGSFKRPLCPVREMGRHSAHFTNWPISLPISRIAQHHVWNFYARMYVNILNVLCTLAYFVTWAISQIAHNIYIEDRRPTDRPTSHFGNFRTAISRQRFTDLIRIWF